MVVESLRGLSNRGGGGGRGGGDGDGGARPQVGKQQKQQQQSLQANTSKHIPVPVPFHTRLQDTYTRINTTSQVFARRRLQAWGRFVATHQITVLLVCCLFLCTLTYPVLSLYARTSASNSSDFFTFLRKSPTWDLIGADASITRTSDLRLPWQDLDAIVTNAEEACWQRIPKFREITVQQVLLGFPSSGPIASEHGVLDRRTLHTVHLLQERLQDALRNTSSPASTSYAVQPGLPPLAPITCAKVTTTTSSSLLRGGSGAEHDRDASLEQEHSPSQQDCFVLSPMLYWDNDENAMLSDTSLIATVNSDSYEYHQLPLKQEKLFLGRTHSGSTMRKADYAVLTLFLEESPSRETVNDFVQEMAKDLDLVLLSRSRTASKTVMKHRSDVKVRSRTWEDILFYLGYVIVGLYIYLTLRKLERVHSRPGLVLTGIVQLLASGMMSLSLCALCGYKINLVPWKLIPFLIVVLGVDNMFVLTTSVSGTSINLPVKERVAEGLGQSGLSIFLNLLAELGALWALYLAIPTRVIREMVVFGAVALVMDYMMEMTYFLTVLSIDMQRLELADLIRQETRMPIKSASHRKDVCTKSIPRLIEGVLDSIRQRTARTYSAIILVGSNLLLYVLYGPDYFVPAFCTNLNFPEGPRIDRQPGSSLTSSEAFWRLLGARPSEAVHVHLASPIVYLFNTNHQDVGRAFASGFKRATLVAALKFVVVPISLTTFGLYLLLRQLLKGSEMLQNDSSHDHTLAGETPPKPVPPTYSCVTFDSSNISDIEAVATNSCGSSWATWAPPERKIHVTIHSSQTSTNIGSPTVIEIALHKLVKSRDVVTALAIDNISSHCAAVINGRRVLVWCIGDAAPIPRLVRCFDEERFPARVIQLRSYDSVIKSDQTPPRAGLARSSISTPKAYFHLLLADGSLLRLGDDVDTVVPPRQQASGQISAFQPTLSHLGTGIVSLARPGLNGAMEVWRIAENGDGEHRLAAEIAVDHQSGPITSLAACDVVGSTFVAIGTSYGAVELWDLQGSRRVQTLQPFDRSVRRLCLLDLTGVRCENCSVPAGESMAVLASSLTSMSVYRLFPNGQESCDCNAFSPTLTPSASSTGLSFGTSHIRRIPSPLHGVSDDGSNGNNLSYPLSPHALRRLSHTSERKKAEEMLHKVDTALTSETIIENGNPTDSYHHPEHPREISETRSDLSNASNGSRLLQAVWSSQLVGSVTIDEKGAWAAVGTKVVGLGRSKRIPGPNMLARWEIWTVDIAHPFSSQHHTGGDLIVHATPLTSLPKASLGPGPLDVSRWQESNVGNSSSSSSTGSQEASLPFDRIRHFHPSDSGRIVAAMGNTLLVLQMHSKGDDSTSVAKRPSMQLYR